MVPYISFLAALVLVPVALSSPSPQPEPSLNFTVFASSGPGFDISNVPSQCSSDCQVLSDISQCTTTTCVCSTDVSSQVAKCLDCVVTYDKSTYTAAGQTSMDIYINECAKIGIKLDTPMIEPEGSAALSSVRLNLLGLVFATFAVISLS